MNNLILSDNLKMVNITTLTEKRVKHIKMGELESLLSSIPTGYKKAIISSLKTIFTEKNQEIVDSKRLDLAQMIEQVIWINVQKNIQDKIDTAKDSTK